MERVKDLKASFTEADMDLFTCKYLLERMDYKRKSEMGDHERALYKRTQQKLVKYYYEYKNSQENSWTNCAEALLELTYQEMAYLIMIMSNNYHNEYDRYIEYRDYVISLLTYRLLGDINKRVAREDREEASKPQEVYIPGRRIKNRHYTNNYP